MTFEQLTSYIWLQQALLAMFMTWFYDNAIFDSITSGGIAYAGMPGAQIDERVAVRNDGSQDAYVRVIINRSWYRDGKKVPDIDPREIGIVTDTSGSDWFIDDTSDPNGEQVVISARSGGK